MASIILQNLGYVIRLPLSVRSSSYFKDPGSFKLHCFPVAPKGTVNIYSFFIYHQKKITSYILWSLLDLKDVFLCLFVSFTGGLPGCITLCIPEALNPDIMNVIVSLWHKKTSRFAGG